MQIELIIAIILFLSIPIIGNYVIHKYFENKRKTLMECLHNKEYVLIQKLNTKVKGKLYYRKLKSDLIIYEKSLILLPYNWLFGGYLKQFQPIIQYSVNLNQEGLKGINKMKVLEFVSLSNSKLILGFKKTYNLGSNMKIEFDFSDKNLNLKEMLDENHIPQNNLMFF